MASTKRKRSSKLLSDEDKASLESRFSALNCDVKELAESPITSSNVVDTSKTLSQKLQECNKLSKIAFDTTSRKGIELDAGFFVKSGHVSTKLAKAIESDSKAFDRIQFAVNFTNMLRSQPLRGLSQNQSCRSSNKRTSSEDLIQFGATYGHIIKDIPVYQFLYGVVDGPDVVFESKTKRPRTTRAKNMVAPLTRPSTLTAAEAAGVKNDRTAKSVEAMFSGLKKQCRQSSGCTPFLRAVNDSTSFSKTVENIFHSAFLIKEGCVGLKEEPASSSCVAEIINERGETDTGVSTKTKQTILSFSMADWLRWKEK